MELDHRDSFALHIFLRKSTGFTAYTNIADTFRNEADSGRVSLDFQKKRITLEANGSNVDKLEGMAKAQGAKTLRMPSFQK